MSEWERDYDWYVSGEYVVRDLILNGGDYDILSRVEDYLYEEKVSSVPWPPPRIHNRGVDC